MSSYHTGADYRAIAEATDYLDDIDPRETPGYRYPVLALWLEREQRAQLRQPPQPRVQGLPWRRS